MTDAQTFGNEITRLIARAALVEPDLVMRHSREVLRREAAAVVLAVRGVRPSVDLLVLVRR